MTFAVLAEYSEQGQFKVIVISSDWRGPPVPTAMSVQSYMWVGPPDLLLNLTHKCLKLALTLRSPFCDVTPLAWHTVTMFRRNFFREESGRNLPNCMASELRRRWP